MPDDFKYDVFLSHSAKDKDIVRPLAERLRSDGLRVWFDEWELRAGDGVPARIEEGLEASRVLVLCMSANAFSSDWATLESYTFRFRDPLNKERRFIPLRLDDAPIKGSLAQFNYINWLPETQEYEYEKFLDACRSPGKAPMAEALIVSSQIAEEIFLLEDYEDATIWTYAFSPDGNHVLTGADDNTIRLWDVKTGRCQRILEGHNDQVICIDWSSDQRYVLSGAKDQTVRLWDLRTWHCLSIFEDHTGAVWSAAWSANQRRALSSGNDETVRLWDVKTGKCLKVLKGHTDCVNTVFWSADQRFALSGSTDCDVRFWDLETGRCLRVFKGHSDLVSSVSLSSDQLLVVSSSWDNTVRLWDLMTGRCLRILEGHTGGVYSAVWSPDYNYVLSGSADKTLRLWETRTGRCLRELTGHISGARSVAWRRDQRLAFSGDRNGGVRWWDLSEFVTEAEVPRVTIPTSPPTFDQVQYTNAKVLVVGDTSAGKTGLAHRLATGQWKPSDGSTVGAWSTQWPLPNVSTTQNDDELEREIWLWDFGGQADQRLVHQLYMDRTALILLLFDADKEDALPGLRDWQMALRRSVPATTPLLLVAGALIRASVRAARSCSSLPRSKVFVTSRLARRMAQAARR
jgi:WD40 repeat protein